MKTSHTKLKSSFFLLLSLAAMPLWAKPVAQVIEVSGQVFVVTPEGKTSSLKVNDHLEEKSEIMVEEGGAVTLNDYYDASYHLIGGSHLKFFNKSVQLKRGKTWIQSQTTKHPLALTTANGLVEFSKSEFIVTFDQASARSQFLVVNGDVDVSNVLDKNMKYSVSSGNFTLIDPEVENGLPRTPTKVGLSSLNLALAEFKKLPEVIKQAPARSIASVEEAAAPKKGEIIFISTNRLPASVRGSAQDYWKKKATVKAKASSELSTAPITFYGTSWSKVIAPEVTTRTPASVAPVQIMPKKSVHTLNVDPEFSESLKKETANQPKFSKELEGLIEDLKSY